ncbi:hypothetical protein Leryth_020695 [Lithospermum erythrorhizon]|nr:hypothetical protein Leryth_020695 [Lithospermum erythrorhizon]
MVECTGEGVLFIEADADVKLEDFGEDDLHPPSIPCLDKLLYDVPGSSGILNSPLLLIQVTRLACGGFILGMRFNHTMSDGIGLQQFMIAISEIAKGLTSPSILPVWQRELFSARHPPQITHVHHEYDHIPDTNNIIQQNKLIKRSFFFGPEEISILRNLVMMESQNKYSSFDLIAACVWRCRTIALQYDPNEEVRFLCVINARGRIHPPLVPAGYYGNTFVYPTGLSTAGELGENDLAYAVDIISRIKSQVTKEYIQSVADFMVLKGRPPFSYARTYMVSDSTKTGFENVDFGWGKPVYGGVAEADIVPGVGCLYIPIERKNNSGKGILVPVTLHPSAMERFEKELRIILNKQWSRI